LTDASRHNSADEKQRFKRIFEHKIHFDY